MESFFTVSEQTWLFLWACVLGAALGVVYDIFRLLRILIKHNKVGVFIEDVIFTLFYSLCLFVYTTERSRGDMRFFIILGSLLGFTVYILTIGMVIVTVLRRIINLLRKIISKLYKLISKPIKAFFGFFAQKGKKFFGHFTKSYKKRKINSSKGLKPSNSVVYNNHNNTHITMTGSENYNAGKKSGKRQKKEKILCNQTP